MMPLIIITTSCNNKEQSNANSENATNVKLKPRTNDFSFEVYQKSADDFLLFRLDRKTGDIQVRNSNGNWYLAKNNLSTEIYEFPVYEFKIIDGDNKDNFQIVLLDTSTGEIYVRSYSSSWYLGTTPDMVK